jgi:hypothetical protein
VLGDLRETALVHALHWTARAALRLTSPLVAKRLVDAVGRRVPPYATLHDAKDGLRRLCGRGACLSRGLTIAARLPGSQVVIAVDPRSSAKLAAHAWVEIDGVTIEEPCGSRFQEIARFA